MELKKLRNKHQSLVLTDYKSSEFNIRYFTEIKRLQLLFENILRTGGRG
jgi:hypothetical protein